MPPSSEDIVTVFGGLNGKWKQVSVENLSEQLKAQGVNWLIRKIVAKATTVIMYTVEPEMKIVNTVIHIAGIAIPKTSIEVGNDAPCVIEAIGKVMEIWNSIQDNSQGVVKSVVYNNKRDRERGKVAYKTRMTWEYASGATAYTAKTVTQVPGHSDVVSIAHFERVSGRPVTSIDTKSGTQTPTAKKNASMQAAQQDASRRHRRYSAPSLMGLAPKLAAEEGVKTGGESAVRVATHNHEPGSTPKKRGRRHSTGAMIGIAASVASLLMVHSLPVGPFLPVRDRHI
jgi:hypothetical protein